VKDHHQKMSNCYK